MIIMLYPCQGLQTLHENRPLRAIAASSSVTIPFMKGEPGHPASNEQQGPGLPASADSDLEAKGVPSGGFLQPSALPLGSLQGPDPHPGPGSSFQRSLSLGRIDEDRVAKVVQGGPAASGSVYHAHDLFGGLGTLSVLEALEKE